MKKLAVLLIACAISSTTSLARDSRQAVPLDSVAYFVGKFIIDSTDNWSLRYWCLSQDTLDRDTLALTDSMMKRKIVWAAMENSQPFAQADINYLVQAVIPTEPDWREYAFSILSCIRGCDHDECILVSWKKTSRGLEFQSAIFTPDRTWLARLTKVAVFPDQSALVGINVSDPSLATLGNRDVFYRTTIGGKPSIIYDSKHPFDSLSSLDYSLVIKCDLSRVRNPFYRFAELILFVYEPYRSEGDFHSNGLGLDSSSVRTIDLWELAKQKFGIDTTQIELVYFPHYK